MTLRGPCRRPDSLVFGHSVHDVRLRLGAALFRESHVSADSLATLSPEGLASAVPREAGRFCDACFTGNHPVAIGEHVFQGKQKVPDSCGEHEPGQPNRREGVEP